MMRKFIRTFIDVILPPHPSVLVARSVTARELTKVLRVRTAKEAWIVALFSYTNETVRALVKAVKFYNETAPLPAAGEVASDILIEMITDRRHFHGWDTPLLIPIPSSPQRLRERGYNQAARFAESMLPFLGEAVEYMPHLLAREDRESQVRMPREKRTENIRGAFFATAPALLTDRQVILIDDVIESASTMKDARRALRSAGVKDVLGIAIAH